MSQVKYFSVNFHFLKYEAVVMLIKIIRELTKNTLNTIDIIGL